MLEGSGEAASTNGLAARLDVTPAAVSGMLRKLAGLGLVEHEPYRGVRLTERGGRLVALEVIRHHRLLELFLVESLGMGWDEVHAEAEVLEHVLSEDLEELIAAKLGHPTLDPARRSDPEPRARDRRGRRKLRPVPARARRLRDLRQSLGRRRRDASLPDRARDQAGSAARGARASTLRRSAVGSASASRFTCSAQCCPAQSGCRRLREKARLWAGARRRSDRRGAAR